MIHDLATARTLIRLFVKNSWMVLLCREDLFLVAEIKSLNTKDTKATKEIHKEKIRVRPRNP
jgi:hypothetical protein